MTRAMRWVRGDSSFSRARFTFAARAAMETVEKLCVTHPNCSLLMLLVLVFLSHSSFTKIVARLESQALVVSVCSSPLPCPGMIVEFALLEPVLVLD